MDDEHPDDADASLTGRLDVSVALSVVVKTPELPTEIALAVTLVAIEVQIRLVSLLVFV
jgi:hypothetical protein